MKKLFTVFLLITVFILLNVSTVFADTCPWNPVHIYANYACGEPSRDWDWSHGPIYPTDAYCHAHTWKNHTTVACPDKSHGPNGQYDPMYGEHQEITYHVYDLCIFEGYLYWCYY